MLNKFKSIYNYRLVKKSEKKWISQKQKNQVFYYKGGLSGRFITIDRKTVRYGTYDGACPSIESAIFAIQGLTLYRTEKEALTKVEEIVKGVGCA